jgi:hypothetical protein
MGDRAETFEAWMPQEGAGCPSSGMSRSGGKAFRFSRGVAALLIRR